MEDLAADSLQRVHQHAIRLAELEAALVAARRDRDAAIRTAFEDDHHPIVTIAAAAGVTRARVSSILGYPHPRPGRPSNQR